MGSNTTNPFPLVQNQGNVNSNHTPIDQMQAPTQNQLYQHEFQASSSTYQNPRSQQQEYVKVHSDPYDQANAYYALDGPDVTQPQQRVTDIETSIYTEFGCYTCLVYFQLITGSFGLIVTLMSPGYFQINRGPVVLQFLVSSCMVLACGFVLSARQSFKSEKQRIALTAFYVALGFDVLNVLLSTSEYKDQKYSGAQEDEGLAILAIPIAAIMYFILISNTQKILKLMTEREKLICNRSDIELQ